ncbi:glycoside hydrolase family 65 protein [Marinilabiliaceae bacterium JC017]|nr:glycoside hydrolase family 65 protein [Marinilabiliaceae bacterium JC017]
MKRVTIFLLGIIAMLNTAIAKEKDQGWLIKATSVENYVGSPVANGRIGIMPWSQPFSVNSVVMNHVFERESPKGISKVMLGINPFNLEMQLDGESVTPATISQWEQVVNMREASHNTSFNVKGKAKVEYAIRALRNMPYGGLVTVKVTPRTDLTMKVSNVIYVPDEYKEVYSWFRMLRDLDTTMPVFQSIAKSPFGNQEVAGSSGFIFKGERPELNEEKGESYHQNRLFFEVSLKKGVPYEFSLFGAVCSTRDFKDPHGESERMVVFAQLEGADKLIAAHNAMWDELWQGDIIIEGDMQSQLDVRFALYNLYAFSRAGTDLSISPMGLSSQGYNGHVFWDTELWMFPPLLVMNQPIAESLVNYRYVRLAKAMQKAENFGYKGAMFPWESDDSGEEATPTWCLTGTFEHHITADVAIAFWNYYRVTKDKAWLATKGYPVLKAVADFWTSRATINTDGSYSIVNVVGANEYAHGVTDNAFTNGAAREALDFATRAAHVLDLIPDPQWMKVSDGLRILKFENGVTREHSTYEGDIIKQADVNLLAYPLEYVTDQDAIRKDLEYYEPKIAKEGPAMTFSVFSVLYARMGDADKAFKMFKRCYVPNKRAPFGVLAESAVSNNPYFATGAGGMLQAVINGFGGINITDNGIERVESVLPKHWKSLTLKGVGPEKETIIIENR